MKRTRIRERAKAKGTYISLQWKGIVEKVRTITPEQILVVSKGGQHMHRPHQCNIYYSSRGKERRRRRRTKREVEKWRREIRSSCGCFNRWEPKIERLLWSSNKWRLLCPTGKKERERVRIQSTQWSISPWSPRVAPEDKDGTIARQRQYKTDRARKVRQVWMQEKGRKKKNPYLKGGEGRHEVGAGAVARGPGTSSTSPRSGSGTKKSRSSSSTITRLWTRRRRRRWASSVGGATDSNHGQSRTPLGTCREKNIEEKVLCLDMLSVRGRGDEGSGICKQSMASKNNRKQGERIRVQKRRALREWGIGWVTR